MTGLEGACMSKDKIFRIFGLIAFFSAFSVAAFSQPKPKVRTVTIPISIQSDKPQKQQQSEEFIEAGEIIVKENGTEQQILSIKSVSNTPLSLAVLIQDDLTSSANLQLKSIAEFIRGLPKGSRVMVGYLRGGSLQTRQKFTDDLEKAANSLRIIAGRGAASGNPFSAVEDALGKFDALPAGRRAILMVSDGLDVSNGTDFASTIQSVELDRVILKAQRKSIAVYSFWNAATFTESGNSVLISGGQGALSRLSDETGGRAFTQGTISPISFEPFFKDLTNSLNRQFALTYLSTNMKKGFYKVQVLSTNEDVKIEHPKGYYYR
jgi:VWFA-related protein